MNENKPVKHGALWTVLFAVVSLVWIFPIVLVHHQLLQAEGVHLQERVLPA